MRNSSDISQFSDYSLHSSDFYSESSGRYYDESYSSGSDGDEFSDFDFKLKTNRSDSDEDRVQYDDGSTDLGACHFRHFDFQPMLTRHLDRGFSSEGFSSKQNSNSCRNVRQLTRASLWQFDHQYAPKSQTARPWLGPAMFVVDNSPQFRRHTLDPLCRHGKYNVRSKNKDATVEKFGVKVHHPRFDVNVDNLADCQDESRNISPDFHMHSPRNGSPDYGCSQVSAHTHSALNYFLVFGFAMHIPCYLFFTLLV